MTKIDVFSGFLGAGKTTLIKKLIAEAYKGEKLVLIENEFGEIGVDGSFMKEAGIEVTEMSQGCICCSLVGDFAEALKKILAEYAPDRILIEPTGVGKLSDIIRAVQGIDNADLALNTFTAVVDAKKAKVYMKNFGEFYLDQVQNASCIVLSRTAGMSEEKLAACVALLREQNADATIITTDWAEINGAQILEAMEQKNTLQAELLRLAAAAAEEEEHHHHHHHHDDDDDDDDECECGHHHHHHDDDDDDDDECECGHHHHHHDDDDDDDDECECGHHHHHHDDDDDDECECGHHHHHHDDDDDDDDECGHHHHHDHECGCGHHHHHHHGHDADEIFTSFGAETARVYTEDEVKAALAALDDAAKYGTVLRAKGILPCSDGTWLHFDFVPEEMEIRRGAAEVTGRVCVIGSELNEDALKELFLL